VIVHYAHIKLINQLDHIIQKSQTLLLKHRDSGDINSLTFILLFMGLLFFFGVSAVIIKYGLVTRYIVFLAVLILLFIFYKFKMSSAAAINRETANYTNIDPNEKGLYADGLVNYLNTGYDLKLTRINAVKKFFIILFPLFLITMKEFFHGILTNKELGIYLVVLYPLSYLVWHLYFKEDLYQSNLVKEDIIQIKEELKAL